MTGTNHGNIHGSSVISVAFRCSKSTAHETHTGAAGRRAKPACPEDGVGMVRQSLGVAPAPVPYWLTTHRKQQSSKRIRFVYDRVTALLSCKHLPPRIGI